MPVASTTYTRRENKRTYSARTKNLRWQVTQMKAWKREEMPNGWERTQSVNISVPTAVPNQWETGRWSKVRAAWAHKQL